MKNLENTNSNKLLPNYRFDLISNLTTINVVKIQDNCWKIIENGNYQGEKSDNQVLEMVKRLKIEGFDFVSSNLNY